MKILSVFVLAAVLFFCGCVNVDYVGQRLPERDSSEYIHIYPSMEEVPTEYKVLGRGKVMTPNSYDLDKLDAVLTEKAQEVGADAVAIASKKRVTVTVNDSIRTSGNRPNGSWHTQSTSPDGRYIYTDSFGKQQGLKNVRTERYRIYYQVVFLTKTDITAKPAAKR
ncbi:MAG: hypothetical protein IKB71_07865 [Lentisphaeria bacterium]|nr:hypothetical protein [Lentisphaeria bacterium]